MSFKRAWMATGLATVALVAAGCDGRQSGGDIVTSGTTPATVPNGPGTPTDIGSSTGQDTTSTSSTATGAAPAPGSGGTPESESQQQGTTEGSP